MASTKRGPGAGNTEASKINAPLKSDSDHKETRPSAQRLTREPVESYTGARRAYAVYDGRERLGRFIFNERTQQALAWDASRRFIGRFGSFKAAARAIGAAAVTERHAADARRRLNDPSPPFVTGLPEHFLRRGR